MSEAATDAFREQFHRELELDTDTAQPDDTDAEAGAVQPDATPQERARDEQGRFAPAEPEAQEPDADPDVQNFIQHHGGGDPQKALRAAVALQKERGATQQELGQLRQMVQQIQQQTEPEFDDEALSDQIGEDPRAVAQYAVQQGDWNLYNRTLSEWKDVDPFAAADFHGDLKLRLAQAEWQQQAAPAQALVQNEQLANSLQEVAAVHPEFRDDNTVNQMLEQPAIRQLISGPLQNAISQGTSEQRRQALETVVYMWRGLQGATPGHPMMPEGNAAQAAPTQASLAQAARVATGSYSPARGAEDPDARAKRWFRKSVGLDQEA